MKVFLVSCFLTITFFSQGWGRPGTYLVQTENDDESLDEKNLGKDKNTDTGDKGDYNRIGTINAHGSNVWNTQNDNNPCWGDYANSIGTINAHGSNVYNTQNSNGHPGYSGNSIGTINAQGSNVWNTQNS